MWTGELYARDFNSERCFFIKRRLFKWKISALVWRFFQAEGLSGRVLIIPIIRPSVNGDCIETVVEEIDLDKYWQAISQT